MRNIRATKEWTEREVDDALAAVRKVAEYYRKRHSD